MSQTLQSGFYYPSQDRQESYNPYHESAKQDEFNKDFHKSTRLNYPPIEHGTGSVQREKPWWMLGYEKWSSIGLFVFFGGAMLGYSLARTPMLSFSNLLKLTTPGEGYWYERLPGKASIMIHIFTSIPASFFSVFCFLPITYNHWPRFHNFVGYIVSLLLVMSSVAGAIVARRAQGGELNFQAGVYMAASAAVYAVVMGCVEAKRGALDAHREWMLRAWFYNGAFVTTRVTALISAQVITAVNSYYAVWQCAEVGYVLKTPEALAQSFPQCGTSDALANPNAIHVAVRTSWKQGDLGRASAMRASYGMALWVAMILHFVGIELYLRATMDESKRLRELSERRTTGHERTERRH